MGDKTTARQTAIEAGVCYSGTPGVVGNLSDAIKAAEEIGYPVMVKASSGGGGEESALPSVMKNCRMPIAAKSEALACFGDDRVYIERFRPGSASY